MSLSYFKSQWLLALPYNMVVALPSPSSISSLWNFGSILGLFLMVQVASGLFLSMHYVSGSECAFDSVVHICNDVNHGWFFRTLHANGASFYFLALYVHVFRGVYYSGYSNTLVWSVGITILFLSMGAAFLGYVLPWGQMSFWGATVITNLISAVPYVGEVCVEWLWGGFAVSGATLTRFYTLHFLLPMVVLGLVMVHLQAIHEVGSSTSVLNNSNYDKVPFHPFFTVKDVVGFIVILLCLVGVTLTLPYVLGDPDNMMPANPLATPLHIKPEWYFLFAYAILRAVPNKLGGVVLLVVSILILGIFTVTNNTVSISNSTCTKISFWFFLFGVVLLTWLGGNPVEHPYVALSQLLSAWYFCWFSMVIFDL